MQAREVASGATSEFKSDLALQTCQCELKRARCVVPGVPLVQRAAVCLIVYSAQTLVSLLPTADAALPTTSQIKQATLPVTTSDAGRHTAVDTARLEVQTSYITRRQTHADALKQLSCPRLQHRTEDHS